jgi:hypothetical protein
MFSRLSFFDQLTCILKIAQEVNLIVSEANNFKRMSCKITEKIIAKKTSQ